MATGNYFVTNILQNIFYAEQKKENLTTWEWVNSFLGAISLQVTLILLCEKWHATGSAV